MGKGRKFINPKGTAVCRLSRQGSFSASFTSGFENLRGDLAAFLYEPGQDYPDLDQSVDTKIEEVVSNNDDTVKIEAEQRGGGA